MKYQELYKGYRIEKRNEDIAFRINGLLTTHLSLHSVYSHIDKMLKERKKNKQ